MTIAPDLSLSLFFPLLLLLLNIVAKKLSVTGCDVAGDGCLFRILEQIFMIFSKRNKLNCKCSYMGKETIPDFYNSTTTTTFAQSPDDKSNWN
jgi:hypothetical protein